MNNLSPKEVAQLCLDSLEDTRLYLSLDVIIALCKMAHDRSYSDPREALDMAEIALEGAEMIDNDYELARGQQGYLDLTLQAYKQVGKIFYIARMKIRYADFYLQTNRYQQVETLYYEACNILCKLNSIRQELYRVHFNLSLLAENRGTTREYYAI